MNEWKEIKTQEDIEELLDAYGGFHDACLTRAAFQSGTSVDEDLSMCFGNAEEYTLHVTFERQWRPKTLEMNFIGLRQFHLVGAEDNYWPDLFEAYLTFADGLLPGEPQRLIVWSDVPFDLKDLHTGIEEPGDTYIIANRLQWKIAE